MKFFGLPSPPSAGTIGGLKEEVGYEGVIYAVCAQCVYWGDFVDLPTYSTVKCMCFQAVKGILGCTIRKVAGSALRARNVFSCFFLQFSRNPLFCILLPFCDTFLRLKRRKMFLSAGRNNAAAESNTRRETAMLCVCVG